MNKGDISLEDLATKHDLTARSINICLDSGLTSLKRILDFYETNKSFMFIRKCGSKTDKELIELCKKYHDWKPIIEIADNTGLYDKTFQNNTFEMLNINDADISLEDLADKEFLSVRSVSICENADLTSLKRILDFYEKRKSFLFIRNCGVKTENELVQLCQKYQDRKIVEIFDLDKTLTRINVLTPIQKATLNRHLEYLISNLSVRAENGLRKISETLNPKEIFDKIFTKRLDFKDIQFIGDKSVEELNKLKNDIRNFVEILQTFKSEQLSKEYAKLIVKTTFTNLPENFEEQIENAFDANGKIKLFRLLLLLLNSEQLLNRNENKIFQFSFCDINIEQEKIESLETELQLTRERVRQIKTKLENEIQNYFLFISNFVPADLVNYDIDNSKSIQVIDKSLAKKINEVESVNFNSKFYSIIFGILLKKSHSVLGDDEIMCGIKRTTRIRKYLNCYLIKLLLFDNFDFEKFVEDVYQKISGRIEETYSIQFLGYLFEFIDDEGKPFLNEIKSACEIIIFTEFDLVVNFDGYLVFEKNIKKSLHEYCYEILDSFSNPMTIDEIEKELSEKHPDVKKTTDSIRGSLIREKELFVCFGRTSTYALRKWEQEKENFKGGTIKNMVEVYLDKEDSPKHISEILEYLRPFRPDTNERSVLTNLKIDENKKFVFFKGKFVGLVCKNYSRIYTISKPDSKNWEDRFRELKIFRDVNNEKWPSAISKNKNEIALYYFGYRAKKAFYNNELDSKIEEALRSINFPFDEKITRAHDWNEEAKKLIEFFISNQNWPKANSDNKEERALYRFCYINKKAFHNQELSIDKIEILKKMNFNFNLLR